MTDHSTLIICITIVILAAALASLVVNVIRAVAPRWNGMKIGGFIEINKVEEPPMKESKSCPRCNTPMVRTAQSGVVWMCPKCGTTIPEPIEETI